MSCWCVWFFRRMYWMYSVALSRIWARDACGNSGKRHGPDKDLSSAVGWRPPGCAWHRFRDPQPLTDCAIRFRHQNLRAGQRWQEEALLHLV